MPGALTRPIAELALRLRDGRLTARALAEEAIANHDRRGQDLLAYSQWAPDHARKCADAADAAFAVGSVAGPLQGIPTSITNLAVVSASSSGVTVSATVGATGAVVNEGRVTFTLLDANGNIVSLTSAAVVNGAQNPDEAKRFIDGLLHGKGAAALKQAGFKPPPG